MTTTIDAGVSGSTAVSPPASDADRARAVHDALDHLDALLACTESEEADIEAARAAVAEAERARDAARRENADAMPSPAVRETWFCGTCGGRSIRHDAIVEWDPERQDWTVLDVQDNTWCDDCTPSDAGRPMFGIPGDSDATDSMIGGGA